MPKSLRHVQKHMTSSRSLVAILLVAGLYFAPEITKNVMKATGNVAIDAGREGFEKIKETEAYRNVSESVKEKIGPINITVLGD